MAVVVICPPGALCVCMCVCARLLQINDPVLVDSGADGMERSCHNSSSPENLGTQLTSKGPMDNDCICVGCAFRRVTIGMIVQRQLLLAKLSIKQLLMNCGSS